MGKQTAKPAAAPAKSSKTPGAAKSDTTVQPAAAKSAAPARAKASPKKPAPTFDEIQRQAYSVAERRAAEGRSGNATSDWIEAEKELSER